MKKIFRAFSVFLLISAVCGSFAIRESFGATTEGRSDLLPLGATAPAFSLPDVTTGKKVSLDSFAGKKVLVVLFICRHCPFVQHVKGALATLGKDYSGQSVAIVAISANDPDAYPEDAPESLAEMAKEEGFNFPFLFDESQSTAKAYTAVATPDTFIFDQDRKLVYRGRLDSTRPDGPPATAEDAREVIDNLLTSKPISPIQKPAVGCSIKWKK